MERSSLQLISRAGISALSLSYLDTCKAGTIAQKRDGNFHKRIVQERLSTTKIGKPKYGKYKRGRTNLTLRCYS